MEQRWLLGNKQNEIPIGADAVVSPASSGPTLSAAAAPSAASIVGLVATALISISAVSLGVASAVSSTSPPFPYTPPSPPTATYSPPSPTATSPTQDAVTDTCAVSTAIQTSDAYPPPGSDPSYDIYAYPYDEDKLIMIPGFQLPSGEGWYGVPKGFGSRLRLPPGSEMCSGYIYVVSQISNAFASAGFPHPTTIPEGSTYMAELQAFEAQSPMPTVVSNLTLTEGLFVIKTWSILLQIEESVGALDKQFNGDTYYLSKMLTSPTAQIAGITKPDSSKSYLQILWDLFTDPIKYNVIGGSWLPRNFGAHLRGAFEVLPKTGMTAELIEFLETNYGDYPLPQVGYETVAYQNTAVPKHFPTCMKALKMFRWMEDYMVTEGVSLACTGRMSRPIELLVKLLDTEYRAVSGENCTAMWSVADYERDMVRTFEEMYRANGWKQNEHQLGAVVRYYNNDTSTVAYNGNTMGAPLLQTLKDSATLHALWYDTYLQHIEVLNRACVGIYDVKAFGYRYPSDEFAGHHISHDLQFGYDQLSVILCFTEPAGETASMKAFCDSNHYRQDAFFEKWSVTSEDDPRAPWNRQDAFFKKWSVTSVDDPRAPWN